MRTRASIAKHPIHPMLVVVPLGALPTATVFDVLHALGEDDAWRLGALVATLFGVGGIYLAIMPGAWDYAKSIPRSGDVWRAASRHMLLGLSLAALYTVVAGLRLAAGAAADAPLLFAAGGLHAVGLVGLGVQAWWGAGIVMRHAVGVEEDA